MTRMICIPIDSLTKIFADYVGQTGFPPDAVPVTWKFNQQERKLMLVVESPNLEGDEGVEEIHFDLRRMYGVQGPQPVILGVS
jgi:hypothetical protein